MELDKNQEHMIKVVLDDITFMLFDLERGGFLGLDDSFMLASNIQISYKRDLLEESIENGLQTIISDFFIKIKHNDTLVIDFDTRGQLRKFTVRAFDGFVGGMVLNTLDAYRREKFSINS